MAFVRRFITRLLLTSLVATFAVFLAIEVSISGGYEAVLLPMGANPNDPRDAAIIEEFHLDQPLVIRHAHWVADALRGDLGRSTRGGVVVTEYIGHRFTISLELALVSMLLAVVAGVPLGLMAAAADGQPSGRVLTAGLSVAQSLPVFTTATILIWVFAVKLGLFPAAGWTRISESLIGNLDGIVIPAVAIAFAEIGVIARVVRSGVVEVLGEDFIAAAMGKGLSRRYILFRHALRPGSVALLSVLSLNIPSVVAGAFVVEIIFGIGGLGQSLIEASIGRDLHMLLGLTLYTVAVYVVVSALIDLALLWADPRIRRS
ncbi:MAG: ABC transporter permease [Acidimicrobiales bacterium]